MRPAENRTLEKFPGPVSEKPVLIHDGECPVCIRVVEWIRARMDAEAFEFLPCQSDDLPKRFPAVGRDACLKAMHLVLPGGEALIGERAIPEILRRLPRYRWCAGLFALPGAGLLSRAAYRRIAILRHRAFNPSDPSGS